MWEKEQFSKKMYLNTIAISEYSIEYLYSSCRGNIDSNSKLTLAALKL